MTTVSLESAPMVHAPNVLRWAMNGYKFKRDRKAMVEVLKCWDLNDACAHSLLSGKTPWREEDGCVVFEYEGEWRQPALVQ